MEQFLEFATKNWYLFVALIVIIGLLIGNEILRKLRGIIALSPTGALQLINDQNAVVLDIRDIAEYKNGHIPDSRHIPFKEISKRLGELKKFKDKPIIIYCRTDGRASSAGALLKKDGFQILYTLKGGLPSWQNANLPLSKK